MLDPDAVLAEIVTAIQSISRVQAELIGTSSASITDLITGHNFYFGEENSLARSIAQMQAGTVLVAYMDLLGGNFDGATVWKHRLCVYIRPRNKSTDTISGNVAMSGPKLWQVMMTQPITLPAYAANGSAHLRSVELQNGNLQLMDTPTLKHQQDELLADFWVGTLVFPEKGDVIA